MRWGFGGTWTPELTLGWFFCGLDMVRSNVSSMPVVKLPLISTGNSVRLHFLSYFDPYFPTKVLFPLICPTETPDLTLPTSTESAEARDSLKQLLTLLITSDQLRSLLTDSINLFRDLFADAAEQVASASIQVTRTSKKAANKARKNKVGKEDVDLEEAVERSDEVAISAKDIKKKVGRAAEDAVDDVQKNVQKKTKQVSPAILVVDRVDRS